MAALCLITIWEDALSRGTAHWADLEKLHAEDFPSFNPFLCWGNNSSLFVHWTVYCLILNISPMPLSLQRELYHNSQQKSFLVKMSVDYQAQSKEQKDQIVWKCWWEEGNDNISSILPTGRRAWANSSGGFKADVLRGSSPLLKGSVVIELFQQLKRELSMVISPVVVQIYRGKGGGEGRQLGRGSGSTAVGLGHVKEGNPTSYCGWCSCSIEGSWAEESSKWNWHLPTIIIKKMLQSQLLSWVWKENTVWNCLDQISWLFCIETKVGVEILENWSLMYFPDSAFLFPRVLQCHVAPSSHLSSEHPHPHPAEHGVVSCPVSDWVSSFCRRAVWHEIKWVGEEQNAIPQGNPAYF